MNISRKSKSKWISIIVSVALVVLVGTETALSYLSDKTEPVKNNFVKGVVACEVLDTFDGVEKTDVSVKNTGNTSAYVRAQIIINWRSDTNGVEIFARQPQKDVNYEIVFGEDLWQFGDDGFWYYTEPIEPDKATAIFIERVGLIGDAPEGYSLSVDIIASAIQSNPTSVVENEWGVATLGTSIVVN